MIKKMGVINITPNSFSDGGKYNQTDYFDKKLLSSLEFDILDIGAESTAPFNEKVSLNTEIERWSEIALDSIKKNQKLIQIISIDSYKCETIEFLLKWFQENAPDIELIWNDVSGVLDIKTLELLKLNPKLGYILCYTHLPSKDKTQDHMSFIKDGDILGRCIEFIKESSIKLDRLSNRFIFDPCFGFSKTKTQNYELLKSIKKITSVWNKELMVGVSRKSFTKILNKDLIYSEIIHGLIINELSEIENSSLIIRLHDLNIYKSVEFFKKNIK